MGDRTSISWTEATWNPVSGCTPVSEGCAHCYAKKMTERFGGDFSKVTLHPDRLDKPLHWRKPRMVFVPSMGDLFHDDIPQEFIAEVFDVMARAKRHTFQVLTKRPARMAAWVDGIAAIAPGVCKLPGGYGWTASEPWPLSNVWLGVSVENQARVDERIPLLLDTPAAVRFVSAEPLLGPLDLSFWLPGGFTIRHEEGQPPRARPRPPLDWVIVGGESGGPPERRLVEPCGPRYDLWDGAHISHDPKTDIYRKHTPCDGTGWVPKPEALEWVRSIRDQCQAAAVPFWWKQWGPRAGQGTLLDGREHKEMPEVRA